MKKTVWLILFIFLYASLTAAETTSPVKVDSTESESESRTPEAYKLYPAILPFIASAPATGFIGGVGISTGIYLGDPSTTSMSSAITTASYSTKNQLLFTLKSNVFTEWNKWNMVGDWRLFYSSQDTYGLGTGPQPGYGSSLETEGEAMDFDLIRFHETVSRQFILPGLYGGIGYHLDIYSNIEDHKYSNDEYSHHYDYSMRKGYDPHGYMISGLSANLYYDTRDNVANPYSGRFAMASYRHMPEWLGNDQNGSTLWLEYREYINLQESNPRHMLGFWTYGHFSYNDLPYMALPSLGWNQLGRSGRGFPQGRFRGDHIYYAEMEYRFPLPVFRKNPDLLGGVLFANITTVADKYRNVDLFDYIEPAFGAGIRIMIQKESRANLNIDYAMTLDGKGALYININESF